MFPASQSHALLIKVQEGTTHAGSLCRTCRNAHIVRGVNNQNVVHCNGAGGQQPMRMRFEVAECNRYFSAAQPTLYEMEEIAWRLVTKQAGRPIGFVNPSEFRKMREDEGINVPSSR